MKIYRGLDRSQEISAFSAVTIGNFDGIHLAHQEIIRNVIQKSAEAGTQSCVVTFDPHPRKILYPQEELQLILHLDHKIKLLEELGVDQMLILPFNQDLARTDAVTFIKDYLWSHLRFKSVTVGENYRFGRQREGDTQLLARLGKELGFEVDWVRSLETNGSTISSSIVRKLIREGNFGSASEILGRTYSIQGCVKHGMGLGAPMGFCTANLDLTDLVHPPRGVYFVKILLPDQTKVSGVANLGVAPTLGGGLERLEVHLLDFDQDIYGQEIEVVFIQWIRSEQTFGSVEDLKDQIRKDVAFAREAAGLVTLPPVRLSCDGAGTYESCQ